MIQSEEIFLDLVDRFFPKSSHKKDLLLGRGDDCAVWSAGQDLCISSDLFIQDVHFDRRYFTAGDIGYKALAVNISDVAGMGARPAGFNLSLMMPPELGFGFWQDFLGEMASLAGNWDLVLCGGDLSKASCLGVDITIWGYAEGEDFLQRGRCRPGDYLFCVGTLGLSRVGLAVLDGGAVRDSYPAACKAHLRPDIFVEQAAVLAKVPSLRGLMDVSDGLARDLPRFLGPGLGAELFLHEQHLHPEVLQYARESNEDPLETALLGGEDYALLGAVAAEGAEDLRNKLPEVTWLGEVSAQNRIRVQDREINITGFDHFAG